MNRVELIASGKLLTVRYGCVDSVLGRLLVGATDRGICYLGFESQGAYEDMIGRYREAEFSEGLQSIELGYIEEYLQGHCSVAHFHVKGTPFQLEVWQALLNIPFGERSSYSSIAQQIGHERAVRAVGSAIGRNPVSLLIPCHRVLRSDESMGGYFWGVDIKRKVLDWERDKKMVR